MACSIYGKLLFIPLLMAVLVQNGRTNEPKVKNYHIDIPASSLLPMTISNLPNRGQKVPENADFTINTDANAIIHLNCSYVNMTNGESLEIITDDSRWTYNSEFDIIANSILMRYRSPKGRDGEFLCTAVVKGRKRKFLIDPNCFCGRERFDPEVWAKGYTPSSHWRGHKRPHARQKRVVKGKNAHGSEQHRLMAYLMTDTTPYCGATLVSTNAAVTSAFCLQNRDVSYPNYILVGHASRKKIDHETHLGASRINQMISHPKYNGSYAYNIAVVMFNPKANFELNLAYPACLPINMYGTLYGRWFSALGFGPTNETGPISANLRGITHYEAIPVEHCQVEYNFGGAAAENEHSLCMMTQNGSDVCGIDSGGPIFYPYQNSRHVYLIGIIGEGSNCDGNRPTMHTNVTHYLGWLSKTLSEEGQSICVK